VIRCQQPPGRRPSAALAVGPQSPTLPTAPGMSSEDGCFLGRALRGFDLTGPAAVSTPCSPTRSRASHGPPARSSGPPCSRGLLPLPCPAAADPRPRVRPHAVPVEVPGDTNPREITKRLALMGPDPAPDSGPGRGPLQGAAARPSTSDRHATVRPIHEHRSRCRGTAGATAHASPRESRPAGAGGAALDGQDDDVHVVGSARRSARASSTAALSSGFLRSPFRSWISATPRCCSQATRLIGTPPPGPGRGRPPAAVRPGPRGTGRGR
jgi:hypothetical protein